MRRTTIIGARGAVVPTEDLAQEDGIAPAIVETGYIPRAQSHSPRIFTENFHSRRNIPFASNNNGFDGAEATRTLVDNDAIKAISPS
jgi:sn-glycerol 3-phosphate transport system substrate-binding protein